MASCSVVNSDENHISIESKCLNLNRVEDADNRVAFSLRIPRSLIWKWRNADHILYTSLVNEDISRLGMRLNESCDVLRQRLKKKVYKCINLLKVV